MLLDVVRNCDSWSAERVVATLDEVDAAAAVLLTVKAHLLAAQADLGAGMRASDRSFADARSRRTGASRWAADQEIAGARALVAMPELAAAVAAREVPVAHVAALGRFAARASAAVVEAMQSDEGRAEVLRLASQAPTGAQFAKDLELYAARVDPERLKSDRDSHHRSRFLTLTHTAEATLLKGRLDPLAGRELALALEATDQRPDADRTVEQARADALHALAVHTNRCPGLQPHPVPATDPTAHAADLAPHGAGLTPDSADLAPHGTGLTPDSADLAPRRTGLTPDGSDRTPRGEYARALAHGDDGEPARRASDLSSMSGRLTAPENRPHVSVLMSVQTLAALRAVQCGSAPPEGFAPAVTSDGLALTLAEAARILCDCTVTRVVVDAASMPLDVGRAQRLHTAHQRRAVHARDRGCAWNGCGALAHWCDVHHVRWWDRDGGETSVENGVALCVFHHQRVHSLDLRVERHGVAWDEGTGLPERVRYSFRNPDGTLENGPPSEPGRSRPRVGRARSGPPVWRATSRPSVDPPGPGVRAELTRARTSAGPPGSGVRAERTRPRPSASRAGGGVESRGVPVADRRGTGPERTRPNAVPPGQGFVQSVGPPPF
ncbi:HNH endonuclease signature motif containing protein [Cellulomonas composti]|uniref:HNH nuclease domain-containing protein n=1 Tax=Cellulomonas composti TaxID=266130 RepID=A0A511JCE6_9CELL|nr:HNH endonuclease signature motif containing protein [Cellulomonas composti]GEL95671.1 hypothetical protein CCO02nite_23290 [Cellulomonas composti]